MTEAERRKNGLCVECGVFSDWYRLCDSCNKKERIASMTTIDEIDLSDKELLGQLTYNHPELADFYQWLGRVVDA